jgi:hypothetical protein
MRNELTSNLKYFSRCQYYGKLLDWQYVSGAMVLIFQVYTATEFYGKQQKIRIYVPTKFEDRLAGELEQGENYLVIAAPYRVTFKNEYRHRVDMLLGIFKEVL